MKNIFALFFFIPLIISCSKTSGESLLLSVQNESVNFVDSASVLNTYSYKNDTIRRKATNVITYTISNPTDKKYVLILDREYLYPHYSEKSMRSGSIGYFIKDANDSLVMCRPGILDTFEDPGFDCKYCIIRDRMDNYARLGISKNYSLKADEYLRYSVTIFPGESRTFKTVTMLPVVLESDDNGGGVFRYPPLKDTYSFELVYNCKALEFRRSLPDYLAAELKANDVEIFNGTLTSNKVPLKVIR